MDDRIDRLGRQLEAIDLAIQAAQAETDPEEKRHLLALVERARDAARSDYEDVVEEDQRRPALRIIKGGLYGAGLAAFTVRARKHPAATVAAGTALASAAVGATILLAQGQHPSDTWAHHPAVTLTAEPPAGPVSPPALTPPAGPQPPLSPVSSAPPTGGPQAHTPPMLSASDLSPTVPLPPATSSTPSPSDKTSAPATTGTPTTSATPSSPTSSPTTSPTTVTSNPGSVCLPLRIRPVLDSRLCLRLHG